MTFRERTPNERSSGRRAFLAGLSALSAGALLPGCATQPEVTGSTSQLERNKALAVRFKNAQAARDGETPSRQLQAPGYRSTREGLHHLIANAQGQSFPVPGSGLSTAIPDRVDVVEQIIAENDTVGLLYRVTGTHKANLFGIPASGRRIDIYEAAILRIVDGRISEGWFLADEAGLMKQTGAKQLPSRKDGKLLVPPITNGGEDPDAVLKRLQSRPLVSREDRNRLVVAQSKSSSPLKDYRTSDYKQLRQGFQHLRDYGNANKVGHERPTLALPDRRDRIDGFIAEGDSIWMQFRISGTHKVSMYGFPATGKRIEIPEIGIAKFVDGKWQQGWYFGDELGLMMQLGAMHMLG